MMRERHVARDGVGARARLRRPAGALLTPALSPGGRGRTSAPADEAPPAGFHRYLPRGRIPSLDDPRFVPSSEANLPPDAWVLGVVMGGQARAYDLNLLTRHEVVNDRYGDEPVAAVWCPLANTAIVYSRRIRDASCTSSPRACSCTAPSSCRTRRPIPTGPSSRGRPCTAQLTGTALEVLPVSTKMLYRDWLRQHPDTLVLSAQGPRAPRAQSPRAVSGLFVRLPRAARQRHPPTHQGARVRLRARGPTLRGARRGSRGGARVRVGTEWVFLYRPPAAALNEDTLAFASPSGFEPSAGTWSEKGTAVRFDPGQRGFTGKAGSRVVQGFDTFWYVWSLNHPDTELLALPERHGPAGRPPGGNRAPSRRGRRLGGDQTRMGNAPCAWSRRSWHSRHASAKGMARSRTGAIGVSQSEHTP